MKNELMKRIFCEHHRTMFLRNFYGDEINLFGGKRSVWFCESCGKQMLKEQLVKNDNETMYGHRFEEWPS